MRRPRYADVAATMALVLALGGTSYAVTALPRNSVGTAQLKAQAVTKAKLAPGVLTIGPMGPRGLQGPAGSSGQPGPQAWPGLLAARSIRSASCTCPARSSESPPGAQFINIAAPCPTGAIALAGGYTISGTVHVSSSIASDFQQGWQITVDNPGANIGTAQAFAVYLGGA